MAHVEVTDKMSTTTLDAPHGRRKKTRSGRAWVLWCQHVKHRGGLAVGHLSPLVNHELQGAHRGFEPLHTLFLSAAYDCLQMASLDGLRET